MLLLGAAVIAAIIIGAGLWWLLRPHAVTTLNERLQAKAGQIEVLSLKAIPSGFEVLENSIQTHEGVIMFSITSGENQITITQQQRPKLMEEVNKQKDVAHPAGKAYIARLGERVVGFLVTDKTLLIISSTHNLEINTLEELLKAFAAS